MSSVTSTSGLAACKLGGETLVSEPVAHQQAAALTMPRRHLDQRDAVCVTNLRLHVRESSSEAQMVDWTTLQVIAATTDLRLWSARWSW